MATDITVPSLGESITEATVSKWLKHPGEPVAADEPVAELETDKVTLEIPAPAAGTLAEILAEEGANVPSGRCSAGSPTERRIPSPTQPCGLGPPSPALRERGPSGARRVRVSRWPLNDLARPSAS